MDITNVVGTCDSYLDLVPNYIKLFTKYSSLDSLFIIGETQTLESIKIYTPGKKPWGERFLNGLNYINTKYILFTLEDYYLTTPIDPYIEYSIDIMENNDIDKISFISNNHFKNYKLNSTNIQGFYLMNPKCDWLATLQMGVWKTETFKNVLQSDYSPWDFENKGREYLINKKCGVLDPNCELTFNFARRGKILSPGWEKFLNSENLIYKS